VIDCLLLKLYIIYLNIYHLHEYRVCFIVGLIVSATMATIIQSAVKSIIVCYADHPHKLYENHPDGTTELTEAISSVFPGVAVPLFTTVII